MADTEEDEKPKKFSLQQVVLGLVGAILIAAISFFGSSVLKAIEKVNTDTTEILLMKKDIENIVRDLSDLQSTTAVMIPAQQQASKDLLELKIRFEQWEKQH